MSQPHPARDDSLPLTVLARIEGIWLRFDDAWKAGEPPRIEEYLGDRVEPDRSALLRELLWVDLSHRGRRGQRPTLQDYEERFPQDVALIRTVFAEVAASPGGAEAERVQVTPGPIDLLDSQRTVDMVPPSVAAGETLPAIPDYEILGVLGRGGMGVVYKARQVKLKRLVALKMILAGDHAGPQELARFQVEAQAVARLHHPGIVQIHQVGEHQGRPFFSLEFCKGGSLAGKLQGNPLPAPLAARLVEKLARAMHHAHQAGIIHRDLKPANVLLGKDSQPKVTDFGLAKHLDSDQQLSHSGAVMGTPAYMAPEQAAGKLREIGPRTDVYALGAILYECLTGRPPFQGPSAAVTVGLVLNLDPVAPTRLNSAVPRELETICLKCLEKPSARRYGSAEALAEDLRRFRTGEPIAARPVGRLERAVKWARRRPAVAGLLAAVASVLLVGTAVAWYFAVQARASATQANGEKDRADREAAAAKASGWQDRQHLYVAHMRLAQAAYEDNNIALVQDMLDRERPGQGEGTDLRGFEWYYLWRLIHSEIRTLKGHTGPVNSVAYSPDGRRLASASEDKTVKIWDVATGEEVRTLKGHIGAVNSVAYSPDGKRLASASYNSFVGPNGVVIEGEMKVWDAATWEEIRTLKGHAEWARSVAFSPDGKRLASASGNKTVRIWDVDTGEEVRTLKGHTDQVVSVAFSPDGKQLASAGGMEMKVWDVATGDEVRSPVGHTSNVWSVSFSPDGRHLASAGADGTVWVWDAATGELVRTLQGHSGGVKSVVFSPDGKRLASAGRSDRMVKIWDAATGEEVRTLKGHTEPVQGVSFSPDGRRVASASGDQTVKIWDTAPGKGDHTLKGHTDWVVSVVFSPNGKRLATGSYDRTVKIWDVATGEEVRTLKGHIGAVSSVVFSPDGRWLASGSQDGTVKIWEAATGVMVRTLQGHSGGVMSVVFSPDGKRLASAGGYDRTVKIWDAVTGEEVRTLKGHTHDVWSVAFSPDGKCLASASGDKTVKIWDVDTGEEVRTLKGHSDKVVSVAFSPTGQRLASASYREVKVWDAITWDEFRSLKGRTNFFGGVSFSPDGRRLATSSLDLTGKVWDVETGEEVCTLKGLNNAVTSVAFSPDGRRLSSATGGVYGPKGVRDAGEVKVWDATPQEGETATPVSAQNNRAARLRWHRAEAADSEAKQQWFAAAFHIRQLIAAQEPDAEQLKVRLQQCEHLLDKLKPDAKPEGSQSPVFEHSLSKADTLQQLFCAWGQYGGRGEVIPGKGLQMGGGHCPGFVWAKRFLGDQYRVQFEVQLLEDGSSASWFLDGPGYGNNPNTGYWCRLDKTTVTLCREGLEAQTAKLSPPIAAGEWATVQTDGENGKIAVNVNGTLLLFQDGKPLTGSLHGWFGMSGGQVLFRNLRLRSSVNDTGRAFQLTPPVTEKPADNGELLYELKLPNANLPSDWYISQPNAVQVENGALVLGDTYNGTPAVLLTKPLPVDLACEVEFEYPGYEAVNFQIGLWSAKQAPQSAKDCQGGWQVELPKGDGASVASWHRGPMDVDDGLSSRSPRIAWQPYYSPMARRKYLARIETHGDEMRAFVDGGLLLKAKKPPGAVSGTTPVFLSLRQFYSSSKIHALRVYRLAPEDKGGASSHPPGKE